MFKIIYNLEALGLVRSKNGHLLYRFSENQAEAFRLSDGTVILLPETGDNSLLFATTNDFKSFLKKPLFPEEIDNPFSKYTTQLTNIGNSISYFKVVLAKEIDITVESIKSDDELKTMFDKLNFKIELINLNKNHLLIPIGIIVGEFLKNKYHLEWDITIHNTFIPYYYPILRRKNKLDFPIWTVIEDFIENRNFEIDEFQRKVAQYVRMIN